MNTSISRRRFTSSLLAAKGVSIAGLSIFGLPSFGASPQAPKVPKKPMPAVSITLQPQAFQSRYSDLGGVLDTTNNVIWGYEPYASLVNAASDYQENTINQSYLNLLASGAVSAPTQAERDAFANASQVAALRKWRWPTVFELRAAVEKGLFTFGPSGLNLYFGSPTRSEAGVSYYTNWSRWSSSETPDKRVHVWNAADGSTYLVNKTSNALGIVVSLL